MNNSEEQESINELTEKIIGCAFEVGNVLGGGFSEKVYENALCIEMEIRGIPFRQQEPMDVYYKGRNAGIFKADIIVNDKVIVELKVAQEISDSHIVQCLNYLKASGLKVGLIFNCKDAKIVVRRVVKDF